MSFEDNMLEDGFNNEMDYLEHLMDLDDERSEYFNNGYDEDGLEDPEYEYTPSPIDKDRKIIRRKNRYGVVSTDYKTIIKCTFDYIEADGSYFTCYINDDDGHQHYTELNRDGRLYEYVDDIEYSCKKKYDYGIQKWNKHLNYYLICTKNKFGCLFWDKENLKFKELLPCAYDKIEIIEDEITGSLIFIIFYLNNRCGLYDIERKVVLPAQYNSIYINNGYISAQIDGWFNIMDFSFSLIIERFSETPLQFSEGRSPIRKNNLYGYVNNNLEIVIQPIYNVANRFLRGIAKVASNKKFGIIDLEGNTILETIYDDLHYYDYTRKGLTFGLIRAKYNGKWGLLDRSGKTIVEFRYENIDINSLEDCYAADDAFISLDAKLLIPNDYAYKKIDHDHNVVLNPNDYRWVSSFFPHSDGAINLSLHKRRPDNQVSLVKSWEDKMGAVNRNGDFIIPCIYDSLVPCNPYNSKIIIAKLKDDFGCINTDGEIIIPFSNHIISYDCYRRNGKPLDIGGIQVDNFTNKGFYIGNNIYTDLTGCLSSGCDNVYYIRKGSLWGAINTDGNKVLDFLYSDIHISTFGLTAICKNCKWGIVDQNIEIIIPCWYKDIRIVDKSSIICETQSGRKIRMTIMHKQRL